MDNTRYIGTIHALNKGKKQGTVKTSEPDGKLLDFGEQSLTVGYQYSTTRLFCVSLSPSFYVLARMTALHR